MPLYINVDQLFTKEAYEIGFDRLVIELLGRKAEIIELSENKWDIIKCKKGTQIESKPIKIESSRSINSLNQFFELQNVEFPFSFNVILEFEENITEVPAKKYEFVYNSQFTVLGDESKLEFIEIPSVLTNSEILYLSLGVFATGQEFIDSLAAQENSSLFLDNKEYERSILAFHSQFIQTLDEQQVLENNGLIHVVQEKEILFDKSCASYEEYEFPNMQLIQQPVTLRATENSVKRSVSKKFQEIIATHQEALDSVVPVRHRDGFDLLFYVHGYYGSWCDFRDLNFRLLLKPFSIKLQTILCQQFYLDSKPLLNIFNLGINLAKEVKQKIKLICGEDYHLLRSINFLGFSLGNIAIEACIQVDTFEDLLPYLEYNFSVNGPYLGSKSIRPIVNIGQCVMTAFTHHECVQQLFLKEIDVSPYQKYYESIYDIMKQKISRKGISDMELLATFSNARLFQRNIIIGSCNDGYVREESSLCSPRTLADEKVRSWFDACKNVEKYSFVHPEAKCKTGRKIDVLTGRNIHIMPLVDQESLEVLASLIFNAFSQK